MPTPLTNLPTGADNPISPAGVDYDTLYQQTIDAKIQALGGETVARLNAGFGLIYPLADPGLGGAIAIGTAVAMNGASVGGVEATVVPATATNIAAGAIYMGIACTVGAPGSRLAVAVDGTLPPKITNIPAGSNVFVRANATTALLERVASFGASDVQVGAANGQGYLALAPTGSVVGTTTGLALPDDATKYLAGDGSWYTLGARIVAGVLQAFTRKQSVAVDAKCSASGDVHSTQVTSGNSTTYQAIFDAFVAPAANTVTKYTAIVTAFDGTNAAAWTVSLVLKNVSGTITVISPTPTDTTPTDSADAGAVTWDVKFDTNAGAPRLQGKGSASIAMTWGAWVDIRSTAL